MLDYTEQSVGVFRRADIKVVSEGLTIPVRNPAYSVGNAGGIKEL